MNAVAIDPVICAWCGAAFETRPGSHCTQCGGPLPVAAKGDRGAPPPPAPRALPAAFRDPLTKNALVKAGKLVMVLAVAFIGLTCATGHGIGLIGLFALWAGHALKRAGQKAGELRLRMLEHGAAAQGEIVRVHLGAGETLDGRHLREIEYTFDVDGNQRAGKLRSTCPSSGLRQPGEPVWVVYDPRDPTNSSLWPPVA